MSGMAGAQEALISAVSCAKREDCRRPPAQVRCSREMINQWFLDCIRAGAHTGASAAKAAP